MPDRLARFLRQHGLHSLPGGLLGKIPLGVSVVDSAGALVWENDAALRIFRGRFPALEPEDWRRNFSCLEVLPPHKPIPLAELPGSLALGGQLAYGKMRFRTPGMRGYAAEVGVPCELVCQPIPAAAGVVGVLSIFWELREDHDLLLRSAHRRIAEAMESLR